MAQAPMPPRMTYHVPQTRERAEGREGFVDVFRTWPVPYEPPARVSAWMKRY